MGRSVRVQVFLILRRGRVSPVAVKWLCWKQTLHCQRVNEISFWTVEIKNNQHFQLQFPTEIVCRCYNLVLFGICAVNRNVKHVFGHKQKHTELKMVGIVHICSTSACWFIFLFLQAKSVFSSVETAHASADRPSAVLRLLVGQLIIHLQARNIQPDQHEVAFSNQTHLSFVLLAALYPHHCCCFMYWSFYRDDYSYISTLSSLSFYFLLRRPRCLCSQSTSSHLTV